VVTAKRADDERYYVKGVKRMCLLIFLHTLAEYVYYLLMYEVFNERLETCCASLRDDNSIQCSLLHSQTSREH